MSQGRQYPIQDVTPLLEVTELQSGYGKKQVLFGASLQVCKGDIVALIGPNGAGKSTMLKAICGLIPVWKGGVVYDGMTINGATAAQNVARGITFVPQGHRVFAELSVIENLEASGFRLEKGEVARRLEEVLELFPALRKHLRQDAGTLSGGERQMLALASALIQRPKVLLLDEPSLGLSPALVSDAIGRIRQINSDAGVTVLVVEQNVRSILEISHRVYVVRQGAVVLHARPQDLTMRDLRSAFLG